MPVPTLSQPPDVRSKRFKDWTFHLWKRVVATYDSGEWTPVLTFATPGNLSVTYSIQYADYTKNGRVVAVNFRIATSAFTHTTASGNLQITGLPFATIAASNYGSSAAITFGGITKANYTSIAAQAGASTSTIVFNASGSAQAASAVTHSDVPSGGTVLLRGTLVYLTDE